MTLTPEEVQHIANLAQIKLSEEELALFSLQLGKILEYFIHIQEVDTSSVLPTSSVGQQADVLRLDKAFPGLEIEDALRNAPDTFKKQFRVPPVFE